ncbi:MAG: PSD1 and planctomycete cytochrome C domain-containing protein [Planctomycetota bacterium]|nr:PSD1 and planctomycete cytochrome C domain-containing protein [Planctomycetota bacterium]
MNRAPMRIAGVWRTNCALGVLVLLGGGMAFVPETNAAEAPRFETHIAPLFKRHCVKCHNAELRKAELDLSTPQGLFRGGESGPVVVSGEPEKSTLYEQVHQGAMPPAEQAQLPAPDVETIRLWIESGTPFVARIALEELTAAAEVSNHDIEPLLRLRCAVCHGLRAQEGGLDVRSKAALLKGGKSGPAIVLGAPAESLLIKRIHAGEMPPDEKLIDAGVKPIAVAEISRLERWIEIGAPEVPVSPDVASSEMDRLVSDEDRQHWSFRRLRPVAIPRGVALQESTAVPRQPVDLFIARKQLVKAMRMSPEAEKLTLLRRVTYDLTGLPPHPVEVEQFLDAPQPDAYERIVDRLLASPRHGERWATFWLDAAGYADSEGKRSADPIRPYAYKYRDYVVRSFNVDKSYDRFLLEQIAGDELADYTDAAHVTEEMVDNLIATGFLRMAPDGTGSDVVNFVPERLEVMADQIEIFGSTILGLTIKCARCHSHKYDPIPQRDYYRLLAIFKGAYDEHDWLKPAFVPGQTKVQKAGRLLSVATAAELSQMTFRNSQIDQEIEQQQRKIAQLAVSVRRQHLEEQLKSVPADLRKPLRALLTIEPGKRGPRQRELAAQYEAQLVLDDAMLKKHPAYKRAAVEIDRTIKSLQSEKVDRPQIRALWDRGVPSPTYVYRRGDYRQWSSLVGPGVPSVLTDGKTPFEYQPPWPNATKTGRRLALARWLVESDHPLTSRVMVNRIWKHHFGRGIVTTIDNFGKLGVPPSHPELLDWLANQFVKSGWSIKRLHHLLVTSQVYRQTSRVSPEQLREDGENQWFTRMPLQRLDAEELRDSLLAVAGRLDERPFGRPDAVNVRQDGLVTSIGEQGSWRRSLYVRHRRKEMPTVLETFDLPQMNPACQQRPTSTVAQQALFLLNNTAVRALSQDFARRVLGYTTDPVAQVERAYLTALGHGPTAEEREVAVQTLLNLEAEFAALSSAAGESQNSAEQALTVLCHTLMNSAAFLFVD